MLSGEYAVVRFVADMARDEPVNIGIIVSGSSGTVFLADDAAIQRMYLADPVLTADDVNAVLGFIADRVRSPAEQITLHGVVRTEPGEAGFIDAIRDQLPERFIVSDARFVEFSAPGSQAMETVAHGILARLVTPHQMRSVAPNHGVGALAHGTST